MKGETGVDWIRDRARLSGEKIALIDIELNRLLTYNELNRSSVRWAAILKQNGVEKGDRVVFYGVNQADVFEILFACAKIGAILVPINWRLASTEIEYIVSDCSPKLVIYNEQFQSMINDMRVARAISLSTLNASPFNHYQLTIETVQETDPWLIIYTGGTTGVPKGVVLSHYSVDWNAINTIISWGLTDEEITLNYMPVFHTGGINALSLPILMNGGTVVIANKFDPSKALLFLRQYKCTIALFVPTMHHMMQQTEEFERLDIPDMKVFLSGGAPCPLSIYEKYAQKGYRFKEGYGLTEAGPNNFYITPEEAMVKRGSVGKAMMFNQVKIMKEDGYEAEPLEVGELLVRGKHAFIRYWNKPEATKEAWEGGWIHTGDLAKRDEDGYYYIVGRKKDMIITGGENVYPGEIEQWLSDHPAVNEAAVVGIPDEKWGEKVTAFVSLYNPDAITKEELIEYCRKKLAPYKVPKLIIILEEIPKTAVGKIDKKVLKEMPQKVK